MQASKSARKAARKVPLFEKFTALVALLNLGLVFFDLSYIPWRNFYLREFPSIIPVYDPLKGIEPHRETEKYLNTVGQLEHQLAQEGLQGSHLQTLLGELRTQSATMIRDNPFEIANKSGTLEKIKNRMRQHMHLDSATQSFETFWSKAYLSQAGWSKELAFFDHEIRPLIATNYFRHIGENGDFIDRFWLIDIFFIAFFSTEFLARTFYLSRRYPTITWLDAMLWRWYDIFLLLPFWRWLRVIPVTLRLHQANLVNLERVQTQINRGVVASLGGEMTSLVVVRVLDIVQDSVERGEVTRWLVQPKRAITVDNKILTLNEKVDSLVHRLLERGVYKVVPKIQPDLEALVNHSLESALNQSPFYQGLQHIPAVGQLPKEMTQQLVHHLSQALYGMLSSSLSDTEGAKIVAQLTQHFNEALSSECQEKETIQDIQSLLSDLLEEVKLLYLQKATEEEPEQTLAEVHQFRLSEPGRK